MLVNADSLRWQHYGTALREHWGAQLPPIHIIDWRDVIERDGHIASLLPEQPTQFRMGSPARGFDIVRGLLRAGQRSLGEAVTDWVPPRPGWLPAPGLLHAGFCHVLQGVQHSLDQHTAWLPPAPAASLCDDIATMFDKSRTSETLAAAGLPVPDWFRPPKTVEALFDALRTRRMQYVFVKLNAASSASGIVVLQHHPTRGWLGLSTVAAIHGHYHNTRRLQRLAGDDLKATLQFLLDQGATVQKAIRKQSVDGQNFDVRIVVMCGEIAATIFRASPHPITNLHLGGQRAAAARALAALSRRAWLDALDDAVSAAAMFSTPTVGVDMLFERGTCRHAIIEVNAFGDFFPHWANDQGQSVYALQVAAMRSRLAC